MSISLSSLGNLLTNCIGIPLFIGGLFGNCLNLIVFLSLRTFRQSSCIIYLTVMSILNIGQLLSGLLPRLFITLFDLDGNDTSLFYCKFRPYIFHVCTVGSLSCLCLATFDQYCATCSRPRQQAWCNTRLAKQLASLNLLIWVIHGIPYLILFYQTVSPATNQVSCVSTDWIFAQYRSYVIVLVLLGFGPVLIATIFGLLAFGNVKQMAFRAVPLVRQALDKQLTSMVLVQVIVNMFTIFPHTIINMLMTIPNLINEPDLHKTFLFIFSLTLLNYYLYFASPFYIYICTSERFRKQLSHVLWKIHFNRCLQLNVPNNLVRPAT
ncbi:unnamed protein product [Adineta ricciae]|uniref:G-protein coupled receptors family 1 profile domain-containing protein n=1 Tax=Adineta ricciae TaxID=249248 RepID=A0A815EN78_ADIRI|nr:unnamed protein product [Adineta ricciae]CAF1314701.1 unnamed protein product [Adineta ricciae]